MHILVTDSGVGGLSVVAYAERFVRLNGITEPVQLTFANAAPANDYGYNSMPTTEEKVATFDRFLASVTDRFEPDAIYVACNTLSVLLEATPFFHASRVPVTGIVETGASLLLNEMQSDPSRAAIVFATQTTIDSDVYARRLVANGIAPDRIVSQACPGLADTISEDREGTRTRAEIRRWVDTAISRMTRCDVPVSAALACTHYGYRRDEFASALTDAGMDASVINPNERAVDDIFRTRGGTVRDARVGFITRYPIPAATVEALTFFLDDISPRTVEAMRNFTHAPDLF